MAWFRHLTIGQKFFLAFGLLLLVLSLSLAAIVLYLSRINSYVERHDRITVPAVVTAVDMRKQLFGMVTLLHALPRAASAQARHEAGARLEQLKAETASRLAFYRTTHAARTHPVLFQMLTEHGQVELADREEAALREIGDLLDSMSRRWTEAVTHWDGRRDAPAAASLREAEALAGDAMDRLERLIDLHAKITSEMKTEGDLLFRQAAFVIVVLVTALGLLIVGTYLAVRAHIAMPLRHLADTADRVAHHDLSATFAPWQSRDEVGTLTQSLRIMLENLRERTVALERKTRELEGFTYSVAHDLKGPLREIEGFSSLIQTKSGDALDATARHYLSIIRTSALRLTALINDLLRYSRLEQQSLPMTTVDVKALVEDIVRDRLAHANGTAPTITVSLPFTHLQGEPTSIQQALINLIDNALKFSRKSNPPEVRISGTVAGRERILSVGDNGIGFDPRDAGKLFGLFERLHAQDDYEGTGVGLAIVKLVMEKHGGRVWAESSPGKGSVFPLAFPDGSADAEAAPA